MEVGWGKSFRISVGSGESTSFWKDLWVGEIKLENKFPRLFRFETNQEVSVMERVISLMDDGPRVGAWRRQPRGRSLGELEDLCRIIQNVSLQADKPDAWSWTGDANGRFSVAAMRRIIEEKNHGDATGQSQMQTKWNSLIPRKINIFIWRALLDKLPVRTALDKRGIDLDSTLCPMCLSCPETLAHCLVSCDYVKRVWILVFDWWGWSGFRDCSVSELLLHPGHAMFNKGICLAWQAVIWTSAYLIWKTRNEKIFQQKVVRVEMLKAVIQSNSFNWISRRSRCGRLSWSVWCNDPVGAARLLG